MALRAGSNSADVRRQIAYRLIRLDRPTEIQQTSQFSFGPRLSNPSDESRDQNEGQPERAEWRTRYALKRGRVIGLMENSKKNQLLRFGQG
jgi:hypothetical protein